MPAFRYVRAPRGPHEQAGLLVSSSQQRYSRLRDEKRKGDRNNTHVTGLRACKGPVVLIGRAAKKTAAASGTDWCIQHAVQKGIIGFATQISMRGKTKASQKPLEAGEVAIAAETAKKMEKKNCKAFEKKTVRRKIYSFLK